MKTIEVLELYKAHLEKGLSARSAPINEGDERFVEDLQLLTAKPVIYVCNVDESW